MSRPGSRVLSQGDVRVSDAPVRIGDSPFAMAALSAAAAEARTEAPAEPAESDSHAHEPELSLVHDEAGNIVRIQIRCRCGEDISIDCHYSDAA